MQRAAPEVNAAVQNYSAYICAETQALTLDLVEGELQDATLLDIDDYKVYIHIQTVGSTVL